MSEVTLELVQARQAEITAMIQKLEQQSKTTTLHIPAADIVLFPGEWYAGAVLNEDGSIKHHTIVAAISDDTHDFDGSNAFAKERGYSAPTPQECRLIVAHKYGRFDGVPWSWFWTCEPHANSNCAWHCNLNYGNVGISNRSAEGGAVAVRRVNP